MLGRKPVHAEDHLGDFAVARPVHAAVDGLKHAAGTPPLLLGQPAVSVYGAIKERSQQLLGRLNAVEAIEIEGDEGGNRILRIQGVEAKQPKRTTRAAMQRLIVIGVFIFRSALNAGS